MVAPRALSPASVGPVGGHRGEAGKAAEDRQPDVVGETCRQRAMVTEDHQIGECSEDDCSSTDDRICVACAHLNPRVSLDGSAFFGHCQNLPS